MLRLTRVRRYAATAVLLLPLAACGVPAQDEPHAVDLPRRPLTTPSTMPGGPIRNGEVAEVLCLVRDGRLSQTVRRVLAAPTPQRHLDDLVAGPTSQERGLGLTSALTGAGLSVTVSAPDDRAHVAGIDPGSARSDDVLAYAQVVCTLTARPDIDTVVFTQDGRPLTVPRGDGSLSGVPLRNEDYRSLIGPS